MPDCCRHRPATESAAASLCPVSGTRSAPVELRTVKALLTETALRRVSSSTHWFCADPSCDVVYFDAESSPYLKQDVRVPVWQKEAFGDRMVCYCFGESEGSIRADIEMTGHSEATERIRAHIAAGRCACEVRNPRGVCCLGDVTDAVKRVGAALNIL